MFIFKKASHLDRKHYVSKGKKVKKVEEQVIEIAVKPELKEIPVVIAKENPFEEVPEVKKPRAPKKTTPVAEEKTEE